MKVLTLFHYKHVFLIKIISTIWFSITQIFASLLDINFLCDYIRLSDPFIPSIDMMVVSVIMLISLDESVSWLVRGSSTLGESIPVTLFHE